MLRTVTRSFFRSKSGICQPRSFFSSLATLDSSKLTVTTTSNKKPKLPKEELKFGGITSDHMLSIDWCADKGWAAPEIIPYGDFALDPACSVFHYGLECFEGMKAYIDSEGHTRLFRPDLNMKRMNSSAGRLHLPAFDGDEFLECIKELVRTDKEWIPEGRGYSLYLRPTMISTYPYLGVAAARNAKLYCILSPVGPYYPTGFAPVKLYADPRMVRAWPGGTGNTKIGGNYAATIGPQMEAADKGYSQVLWLFGDDMEVTEVGTMNQFWFWERKDGQKELITAPLDGTILPGVTRDSILALAREKGEYQVTERIYNLKEIMEAIDEGRLIEAFGCGTAAIVSPVDGFHYKGKDYSVPLDPNNPDAGAGPLTASFAEELMDIQYGIKPHDWSIRID